MVDNAAFPLLKYCARPTCDAVLLLHNHLQFCGAFPTADSNCSVSVPLEINKGKDGLLSSESAPALPSSFSKTKKPHGSSNRSKSLKHSRELHFSTDLHEHDTYTSEEYDRTSEKMPEMTPEVRAQSTMYCWLIVVTLAACESAFACHKRPPFVGICK
jgi:hypothetical protein